MKVAVFETEEWEDAACLRVEAAHELVRSRDPLDERIAGNYADAEVVTTFVDSNLHSEVLRHLKKLRLIATRSTGYDHIDLEYCALHGITVCNVPDYGDSTVAEHVFALLLAISRNLIEAVERARRGRFSQSGLRGFELRDKTLGVIGTGRIGRRVIEIARGFGMSVIAVDVNPNEALAHSLGFHYSNLEGLLAAADVVTIHVPATPQTKHLLSDREFALLKPGAVLINTARGNIVDVTALLRALADGKLRAAGLDVLPQEPLIREEAQIFRTESTVGYDLRALVANHVLLRFPNVIVTPHNAYNTDSALRRIIDTTLANIEAFTRGTPQNVVSAPVQQKRT